MANYGMVIDLHKCVGCGACSITCKNENNVQEGIYWAHYQHKTSGTFPNVKYEYLPTMCNHCENAPCAKACPVNAMYKDENGITMHNADKCIGCKTCMMACPYEVISYNKKSHEFWKDNSSAIKDGTASGAETASKSGAPIPYYNPDRAKTYAGIRPEGVVEKCTLCDHRVKDGDIPYCATSCPAKARIFGDLADPNSEVNELLNKYESFVLKPHFGSKPKVYYIRQYSK